MSIHSQSVDPERPDPATDAPEDPQSGAIEFIDLPPDRGEGLLDPEASDRLESEDRKKPIPGGEPDCPRCAAKMTRRVEKYPAPRGGSSPFRVRLVCPTDECGAWTVYDW
jgi:hypothetical protein